MLTDRSSQSEAEEFPKQPRSFPPSLDKAVPVEGRHHVGLQHEHAPPLLGLVEGERLLGLRRSLEVELSQDAGLGPRDKRATRVAVVTSWQGLPG